MQRTDGRKTNAQKRAQERETLSRCVLLGKKRFQKFSKRKTTKRVCIRASAKTFNSARAGRAARKAKSEQRRNEQTRTWRRGEVPQTSRVSYFWSLFRHLLFFFATDDERGVWMQKGEENTREHSICLGFFYFRLCASFLEKKASAQETHPAKTYHVARARAIEKTTRREKEKRVLLFVRAYIYIYIYV